MVVFSVEKELISDGEEEPPSGEEEVSDALHLDDYVKDDSSAESDKLYENLLPTDSTHLEQILTYTGVDTSDLLSSLEEEEGYLTTGSLVDPYVQEAYEPVEAEGNKTQDVCRDIISYFIRRALDLDPSLCPETEDSVDMVREDDEDMGRIFRHRFYAVNASTFGAEIAVYRFVPAS